jgi:hypothetical protein
MQVLWIAGSQVLFRIVDPPAVPPEEEPREKRFSGRTRQRILKVARTIPDLDSKQVIGDAHLGKAVMLRCLDRERSFLFAADHPWVEPDQSRLAPSIARSRYF